MPDSVSGYRRRWLEGARGGRILATLLRGELYGVSASDPLPYITAVALLIAVIAVATAGPVRRAMRVDPMRSLRSG